MASSLTGCEFSPDGGPDYSERPVLTTRRMEKAGFDPEALWKQHYTEVLRLTKIEAQPQKFPWLRMHYRPTNLPSTDQASQSLAGTSFSRESSTPTTSQENSGASTQSLGLPLPELSSESSEPLHIESSAPSDERPNLLEPPPTDPEPTEDGTNPGYPKRQWTVAPDNTVKIEPTDPTLGLSLEEVMVAARWALLNANHVASRRLKMRKAPSQIAWLFVNWALDDVKTFMSTIFARFEKIEAARLLAQERADAKRDSKRQALMDDDRPLHELLARVRKRPQNDGSAVLAGAKGPRRKLSV